MVVIDLDQCFRMIGAQCGALSTLYSTSLNHRNSGGWGTDQAPQSMENVFHHAVTTFRRNTSLLNHPFCQQHLVLPTLDAEYYVEYLCYRHHYRCWLVLLGCCPGYTEKDEIQKDNAPSEIPVSKTVLCFSMLESSHMSVAPGTILLQAVVGQAVPSTINWNLRILLRQVILLQVCFPFPFTSLHKC